MKLLSRYNLLDIEVPLAQVYPSLHSHQSGLDPICMHLFRYAVLLNQSIHAIYGTYIYMQYMVHYWFCYVDMNPDYTIDTSVNRSLQQSFVVSIA